MGRIAISYDSFPPFLGHTKCYKCNNYGDKALDYVYEMFISNLLFKKPKGVSQSMNERN